MTPGPTSSLRHIPSVDQLLQDAAVARLAKGVPRRIVVECVREAVEHARDLLLSPGPGCGPGCGPDTADPAVLRARIVFDACRRIRSAAGPHYRRVINATGIILHTGLGRAVLAAEALDQIHEQLGGYSLLQADVETGERDKRDGRIEWLLQRLVGCEAATVVNNNAAATWIALNTVGAGREVIVSRGQLVEIGGSFRLPDVMAASGATLVEVGTTNKTHPRDYARAVTPNTAAILRVHPSNYRIEGFTAEVPLETLVAIAREHNIALIDDVGAGPLVDFSRFGFEKEPLLAESVRAGADLITCSADKLIGASQGGLVLGRADWVAKVRKNPIARAIRVGKLTLAALEATLSLFLDEQTALAQVPTLRMLRRGQDDIARQADRIAEQLARQSAAAAFSVVDGFSQMGSGSLPAQNLATRLVAVEPRTLESGALAARLRRADPPVFGRVKKGQVLLDPRTLLDGEEDALVRAVVAALNHDVPAWDEEGV